MSKPPSPKKTTAAPVPPAGALAAARALGLKKPAGTKTAPKKSKSAKA